VVINVSHPKSLETSSLCWFVEPASWALPSLECSRTSLTLPAVPALCWRSKDAKKGEYMHPRPGHPRLYWVSREPCKRLAEVEQPRETRREGLRTRDAQTLAESLPPLSTDVLKPIQHIRTSPFGFPLFEPSVPVPMLDVFLSLLRLLVVAFPVLQLFFADFEPSGCICGCLP